MKPELIYIFPLNGSEQFLDCACKFVDSYHKFPPGCPHSTVIVCNGAKITSEAKCLFSSLPEVTYFEHDNSGYDIGAYIAVAKQSLAELTICMGSSAYLFRKGWMERMVEARIKHGPGLYGSSTSYQEMPHINTTGFWCDPILLSSYPWRVIDNKDRYSFEQDKKHPERPFWKFVHSIGQRALFVTWDGEYEWWDWRKPPNIFRKGDQTNMLIHWRFSDYWREYTPQTQREITFITDTITDIRVDINRHTMP